MLFNETRIQFIFRYIPYCSSDAWSGTLPMGANGNGEFWVLYTGVIRMSSSK